MNLRPNWKPLEGKQELLKTHNLAVGDFMFMHETAQGICTYKHCDTRRSLHIDSLGNYYSYVNGTFYSQTEAQAFEHVTG